MSPVTQCPSACYPKAARAGAVNVSDVRNCARASTARKPLAASAQLMQSRPASAARPPPPNHHLGFRVLFFFSFYFILKFEMGSVDGSVLY